MLWLALHFPWLALEALPLRQSPSAVVSRGRVVVGDRLAEQGGVSPGQRLSTALGLVPGLSVFERVPAREAEALDNLACWAGQFTPSLSLAPPGGLLLDIGACLRLFGGADKIVEAVLQGCAGQQFSVSWAIAPTPLGARWLAQADAAAIYPSLPPMQAALGELLCRVPGWPADILARLVSFGLDRLAELRALPGAGLRRRIGNGPVDELLRAWGELPDPQTAFVFPESFGLSLELPARVEHAEALAFAGQRLFSALHGWLTARQLLLRSCHLQLTHDDASQSTLALRFAEPAADEARFQRLLREHLARLRLSAPVEVLRLEADEVVDKPGASGELFAARATAGEGALACLERLRARLGEAAVQSLALAADYRPECATRPQAVDFDFGQKMALTAGKAGQASGAAAAGNAGLSRPLWLLPVPQALAEWAGLPQWHGPLQLLSRAERLESGWWDEGEQAATGDVRRDYFVARNQQGQWAWVFRNADGWFLHGLFA